MLTLIDEVIFENAIDIIENKHIFPQLLNIYLLEAITTGNGINQNLKIINNLSTRDLHRFRIDKFILNDLVARGMQKY